MTILSDVEAALPDEFSDARSIWRRMGSWSPLQVSEALNRLCHGGCAERTKQPVPQGFVYLYRRARLPQQRAA